MAEALALRRPFDEPGDVGHREVRAVAHAHHTEMGLEGGEGIVGDLGPRRRDHAR